MPIYEYKCNDCDEEFEALVFRTGETVPCPSCKGERVKRLMSACVYKSGRSSGADSYTPSSGGSSGCGGCTSSNCSSCH